MGDKEERISYTADEQKEIDRILSFVDTETDRLMSGFTKTATLERESLPEEFQDDDREAGAYREMEDDVADIDRDMPEDEDIVDITDMVQEVEEPAEPSGAGEFDDLDSLVRDDERRPRSPEARDEADELDTLSTADLDEVADEKPAFKYKPKTKPAEGDEEPSTLDELEALAAGEAVSGDEARENEAVPADGDELASFDDFDMPAEKPREAGKGVSIGGDAESDIPDLSDISFDEAGEMPEAKDEDIPEIDLGGLDDFSAAEKTVPEKSRTAADDAPMSFDEDLPSFDDDALAAPSRAESETAPRAAEKRAVADDDGFGDIPSIDEIDDIVAKEEPAIAAGAYDDDFGMAEPSQTKAASFTEPARERESAPPKEKPAKGARREEQRDGLDLSDRDLKKLKNGLTLLHPNLRKAVRDIILNDVLPEQDARQVLDAIITGKSEDAVLKIVQNKLGKTIDISEPAAGAAGRRVIAGRPEYTKDGIERQKKLLFLTKIFGAAAAVTAVLVVVLYQFWYKPYMAERYIAKGVALIREPGDPVTKKVKDYTKAEELFTFVDENYKKDYLRGYNEYARAYFDKREFDLSLRKLNAAYRIDPVHPETLNSLGYFFSRIPEGYFKQIRPRLKDWYYKEVPPVGSAETQLDVAVDFYRRVLNREPKNITALFGIGNAYKYQGQYLKARQYYENILKIDRKSVVGYSGLLDLFIDRDNFPEVLTVHSDLQDKDLMVKLPSPLLAKLASYYLGKKRTDRMNIRVDYGVESPRLKDIADNPYPVVRSVLSALAERDADYPPLYVHLALLARAQDNPKLMMENLKRAIKRAEARDQQYFAAYHLMGEYHLHVKEPVQAYQNFNRAIKAYSSPADFMREDFYAETESLGKTYAMIGNVFYYFFDKVRHRFGDEIEDRELDQDVEKFANYRIARDKYELAVQEGYKSSELFYNLGRIYYMKGLFENYEKALESWLNLYEDFSARPELMYAVGNAFYHLDNLEASKGEFLKLISVFEHQAERLTAVHPEKAAHVRIFQTLASAYNNLGAIYQRQNNESKSTICYWKSIDYAARLRRESEFARVNLARSFKARQEEISPIIDENVPYAIDIYSEDMRK